MVEQEPSSRDLLGRHYQSLADAYEDFLYYSPDFVRTLTTKMIEMLELTEDDRLADVGCGTGMYTLDILEQVPMRHPALGVDPYPEMLAAIPDDANMVPLAMGALEFSRQDYDYNKVLVKETIHHVGDRPEFFANVHRRLPVGGRMLLVHVPPDVKYPLFQAALERCLGWHADPVELEEQLREAGFEVKRDAVDYHLALPTSTYRAMVENRYMSVLSSFTDEELEAGLAEMDQRYGHLDTLRFIDHFDYLCAVKEG
ncbi:MAG: class I SAM-dependent methyltransferase [Actinomycetota bacterium]